METSKSSPLDGPVILALVLSKSAAPLDTKTSAGGIISVIGIISPGVCLGLMIGALLRLEVACLFWLAGGLALFILGLVIAVWSRHKEPGYESQVTITDQLKEYTRSGILGRPVPGRGVAAWLTEEGVYMDRGRFFSWESYQYYLIRTPEQNTHHVELWKPYQRERANWRSIAGTVLMMLGIVVLNVGWVIGVHRYGLRDDVLATLYIGLLMPGIVAWRLRAGVKSFRSNLRNDGRHVCAMMLNINGRHVSRGEINRLLGQHLVPVEN